jgi:hypothetical protein
MAEQAREQSGDRFQMHLVLPYNIEARRHARVRRYLDAGYRIVELQRVTDREVLVTLATEGSGPE